MTLTLNRQLLTSRQILVAFSGGLDSTVLLHQLVQWRTENPGVTLRAIHVHHGLSANADAWVTHCENVCQQWQVPLVGLVQGDAAWDPDARRGDGLPWLGGLDPATGETGTLAAVLALRWRQIASD